VNTFSSDVDVAEFFNYEKRQNSCKAADHHPIVSVAVLWTNERIWCDYNSIVHHKSDLGLRHL